MRANTPVDLLRFSAHRRLPMIQQTEAAECGLACLAMVLGFHGHRVDINTLRRDHPISLKGATLKNVMNMASRLGLNSRSLRGEVDELDQLTLPAILHWDLNHFVVLKSVGRHIVIHDPAFGEKRLTEAEVSQHFTGVALELTPAETFQKQDDMQRMRLTDFWSQAIGFKRFFAQVIVLGLLLEIFALASPFFMQLVVDQVIVSHDVNLLVVLAIGFLLLSLIQTVTTALRSYVVMYVGNLLSMQMGSNLFRHLIRLPITYFERRNIGDVVSRFGSLDQIRQVFTSGLIETVIDGVMVIGTVIMMFIYGWQLAVLVIGAAALYAGLRLLLYRPFRERTHEQILAGAEEQSNFMESVRGAQTVKLFGGEVERQGLWHNRFADKLNAGIRLTQLNIGFNAASSVLFGVENIAVIYFGAKLVLAGSMTIGMLFAFASFKRHFESKAENLVSKLIQFKMLELYFHRIADIAHTPKETSFEALREPQRTELSGSIALDDVTFRYTEDDPAIVENANLEVQAGEAVALVGPSGCGKSTVTKAMLGLLPIESGTIIVDGTDIHSIGLSEYRRQVAAVMQDDELLSGSLADNICFFEADRDEQRIEECARLAAVDDDIKRMPMGYQSLIGDMGTALSGGQKQRVVLARALYRRPRILFLDEATSHVDEAAERRILSTLADLNITRIIVSHRPQTIRFADRIVALNGGHFTDVTHAALGGT